MKSKEGHLFFRENFKNIQNITIVVGGIVFGLVFFMIHFFLKTAPLISFYISMISFIYIIATSYVLYLIYCFFYLKSQGSQRNNKLYRYIPSYICGFLLLVFSYVLTTQLTSIAFKLFETELLITFIIESVIFTTLILLLHDFVFIQNDRNKTKLENVNLKVKSAEAVNLLLKQQIQPHFLFNSLHTIKALYNDDRELGEKYLILLADFLRLSISGVRAVSHTLAEEVNTCEIYMDMQKIRFGESLKWIVDINQSDSSIWQLPGFSLQPLVENAIKHNLLSIKSPLKISIEQDGEYLTISNNIQKKSYKDESMGTGLANLAERYKIWSSDELEIDNKESIFSVRFKMKRL
ncbi:sensor histidine kinase [uncultured Sphingobacterium sp.]|uniref:sensor histidine kinase n=1 Tax=uncultured Sphingobacterium sp. TaxID=182688 RepID=UPI0025E77B31|nr:histidine kinase [uncultured Sphingobacterium sp.]